MTLPYRKAVIGDVSKSNSGALVLYLHGGSKKGDDNEAQMDEPGISDIANYLSSNNIPAIMIVPQCPRTMSWAVR